MGSIENLEYKLFNTHDYWTSLLGCLEEATNFLELKYAPNTFPMNIKDLNFKS
jgi:hypothetical protein